MTPDDLAAIRADIDVLFDNHFGCDEESCELGETGFRAVQSLPRLLAEVDRLGTIIDLMPVPAQIVEDERARIRAAVEGLEDPRHGPPWLPDDLISRAAVLAAIDGEAT